MTLSNSRNSFRSFEWKSFRSVTITVVIVIPVRATTVTNNMYNATILFQMDVWHELNFFLKEKELGRSKNSQISLILTSSTTKFFLSDAVTKVPNGYCDELIELQLIRSITLWSFIITSLSITVVLIVFFFLIVLYCLIWDKRCRSDCAQSQSEFCFYFLRLNHGSPFHAAMKTVETDNWSKKKITNWLVIINGGVVAVTSGFRIDKISAADNPHTGSDVV